MRIEAMNFVRIVGAMRTLAVNVPEPHVWQVAVPHLVGVLRHFEAGDFAAAAGVEQAELDALGMRGKHREVGAETVPSGAERIGTAGFEPVRKGSQRSINRRGEDK